MHRGSARSRRRCIATGDLRACGVNRMISERVTATYRIESPLPIERAAEVLAGEQSSGTFVAVPGETAELRDRFRARVESITSLESSTSAGLPGSRPPSAPRYHRGE